MSYDLSSSDSSLLVRDVTGDSRPAHADEVLEVAQRVLLQQLHEDPLLTSPESVRDYLRVKLGTLEHEVIPQLAIGSRISSPVKGAG